MKVAGVITNEWELTQLGLNLGVDENEIKRISAGKHSFIIICRVHEDIN